MNTLEKLSSPAGFDFYLVQRKNGEQVGTITRKRGQKWRGLIGFGSKSQNVGFFSDRDDAISAVLYPL